MAFDAHDAIPQPDDDTVLWRYMDLGKYLDLVQTSALPFPPASSMEDPLEGRVGAYNAAMRPTFYRDVPPHVAETMKNFREAARRFTYISCWHASPRESAAMWRLYTDAGKGIAVTTTWGSLKNALGVETDITGGWVQYVDYDTFFFREDNSITPFIHKRDSFDYEKEVRLLITHMPTRPKTEAELADNPPRDEWGDDQDYYDIVDMTLPVPAMKKVRFAIDDVISHAFVSPDTPSWQVESIKSLTMTYGGTWEVIQSDLYSPNLA